MTVSASSQQHLGRFGGSKPAWASLLQAHAIMTTETQAKPRRGRPALFCAVVGRLAPWGCEIACPESADVASSATAERKDGR